MTLTNKRGGSRPTVLIRRERAGLRAVQPPQVPIYYDPQLIKLELTNHQIDAELQEILEGKGADASQAERARWAAVAEAAGTKERLAELAAKLLDHFQKRNKMINGKAMVVCMSRRNCVRLYDALTA